MRIGVPKETAPGEKRIATVPDVVQKLVKLGFTVAVQSGAGVVLCQRFLHEATRSAIAVCISAWQCYWHPSS